MSSSPVGEKRRNLVGFLTTRPDDVDESRQVTRSLEWLTIKESCDAMLNLVSRRNERQAGFSFLEYINGWLHGGGGPEPAPPSEGFFAELEFLMKGVAGTASLYNGTEQAFRNYSGREAAEIRSKELSEMAAAAEEHMDRFACGLEERVVQKRRQNKKRILGFLDASEEDWKNWRWHLRNTITDIGQLSRLIKLTPEEYRSVERAGEYGIPFGVTPYYLSLMDYIPGRGRDYAVRAQVLPDLHYISKLHQIQDDPKSSADFMFERDTSPCDAITRRYPRIVILKPVLTCPQICVYCQRNWQIEDVFSESAVLSKSKLDEALEWIEKTPEINEILVTGGDPLILSDSRIEQILSRLSRMGHVQRIRIGTRTPVTLPSRVTDRLADTIARYHSPGRREIVIVTHYEHTYEITPGSMEAVQKFKRRGMCVYNQFVYTFYVSRRFEAVALRHKLRLIGVDPYYTFNTKGKEETHEYRVPIARLIQERHEESRLMPGTERTDEMVFNVPRLGKNHLRAGQHHRLISILPDGRRMYEFIPWEKNMVLTDTFVYKDISIYDYLQRLKDLGEDISLYRTIWYYY